MSPGVHFYLVMYGQIQHTKHFGLFRHERSFMKSMKSPYQFETQTSDALEVSSTRNSTLFGYALLACCVQNAWNELTEAEQTQETLKGNHP
jgi:hypothetical protein